MVVFIERHSIMISNVVNRTGFEGNKLKHENALEPVKSGFPPPSRPFYHTTIEQQTFICYFKALW